ncbi:MAG: AMP-binding protein [Reichenbachiella sp.]
MNAQLHSKIDIIVMSMKITFLHHEFTLDNIQDLYEQDSSYYPVIEFIRKWRRGDHTFEFHTSGSTGTPKIIPIYRKQIEASVANTAQFLGLKSGEQILLCLDPSYVAAIMMVARGLILDMDIHIVKPSGNPFRENQNLSIDFVSLVPFQVYQMMEQNTFSDLSKIKNILIGGAPLSDDAFNALTILPSNVFLSYGMTETVSHIALMPIKGEIEKAKFQLLPNIFIGTNEDNCLWIDGDITNNQRIQTTDVVELLNDDEFRWVGRRDNVINSGGIKIHPERIENVIRKEFQKLNISNEIYVIGISDDLLGQKIVLFIEGDIKVKNNGNQVDALAIIESPISVQLGKYHLPKEVRVIEKFERTSSGKLKKLHMP